MYNDSDYAATPGPLLTQEAKLYNALYMYVIYTALYNISEIKFQSLIMLMLLFFMRSLIKLIFLQQKKDL